MQNTPHSPSEDTSHAAVRWPSCLAHIRIEIGVNQLRLVRCRVEFVDLNLRVARRTTIGHRCIVCVRTEFAPTVANSVPLEYCT